MPATPDWYAARCAAWSRAAWRGEITWDEAARLVEAWHPVALRLLRGSRANERRVLAGCEDLVERGEARWLLRPVDDLDEYLAGVPRDLGGPPGFGGEREPAALLQRQNRRGVVALCGGELGSATRICFDCHRRELEGAHRQELNWRNGEGTNHPERRLNYINPRPLCRHCQERLSVRDKLCGWCWLSAWKNTRDPGIP